MIEGEPFYDSLGNLKCKKWRAVFTSPEINRLSRIRRKNSRQEIKELLKTACEANCANRCSRNIPLIKREITNSLFENDLLPDPSALEL